MSNKLTKAQTTAVAPELTAADFEELNTTELVALAQELDPNVGLNTPRPHLIALLCGEGPDELPGRAVDGVRLHIMRFVIQNYDQLRPLLDCPAKTKDPRACFRCLDYQVAECATSSAQSLFKEEEKNDHDRDERHRLQDDLP